MNPGWDVGPYLARVKIDRGARGTVETLDIASALTSRALLDPYLPLFWRRKLIVEPGTDPRDARAVFQNAYDYVKTNVGFQPDPLVLGDGQDGGDDSPFDWIQGPHWTMFVEAMGDCLSHASLLGNVSTSLGHGFGYRTLKADPTRPDRFSHAYAILGFKDQATGRDIWIPADTTVESYGLGDEPAPALLAQLDAHDYVVAPAS